MRKAHKKQAEKLLRLLDQVHEGIRTELEADRKQEALELLGQCQDAAIQLGETIEESEGEGFTAVRLLEVYCEQLYQYYEKIRLGEDFSAEKVYKHLHESLIQIENSVKNDIKIRVEAVFLPYKASMWDSLESVWRAAEADPDCDAYVIPIPYFDKNPDGSFRQEHYEGDQYSEDVPVTPYDEYDFASRRPDMVFIHNPYDGCNFVTSVHPFFYSNNLKQYTNQLVYIPYFILREIDPNNQEAVEGVSHFCKVPAMAHADKVVVQSEEMRQIYIGVLAEYVKDSGAGRTFWEHKILGIGSPKIDKVLQTKKEEQKIPVEWKRIIEKSDGSWKSVILYNTGIGALLQYDEQWLRKIKQTLKKFKEKKEKVTLLWRPHPLIEDTMKSMRPGILKKYLHLKENYIKDGWGIYDCSSDLHRAIACSDAYYGDGSSITALYMAEGKPVMIQNTDTIENYAAGELIFENLFDDGEQFWFTSMNFNSLWTMDKTTCEIKYMGSFPAEQGEKWRQFYYIVREADRLFFIPLAADHIAVYSIEEKKFSTISIPEYPDSVEQKIKFNPESKFVGGYIYEHNLYLAPSTYPGILKYNLNTGEMKIIDDWLPEMNGLIKTSYSMGYFSRGICSQNKLFLACIEADALFEFDMEDNSYLFHKINSGNLGYHGICFDGKSYWLSPVKGGSVVKWKRSAGIQAKLNVLTDDEDTLLFPFTDISFCGDDIWLLPLNSDKAIKILPDKNQVVTVDEFQTEIIHPQLKKGIDSKLCFLLQKSNGHKLYAFSVKSCSFFVYDLKNCKLKRWPVRINEEEFVNICTGLMENRGAYHMDCHYEGASELTTLDAYLHLIMNLKDNSIVKKENNMTEFIGNRIYAHMKNEVLCS